MLAEPKYRAILANDLLCAQLDTLMAVYDRRSGQTHLLAAPLPEILGALADGNLTLAGVLGRLAEVYELSDDDSAPAQAGALAASTAAERQSSGLRRSTSLKGTGFKAIIAARLAELAALGLVEIT